MRGRPSPGQSRFVLPEGEFCHRCVDNIWRLFMQFEQAIRYIWACLRRRSIKTVPAGIGEVAILFHTTAVSLSLENSDERIVQSSYDTPF